MLMDFFDWAWLHVPHLTLVGMIVFASVWLAIKVNNFGHRLNATERLCHDIHTRVEERFAKVEDRISKVEDRLSKVEDRLSKIELTLVRIETYLATTTSSKYPV
jgi:hypothetical protein